MGPTPMERLDCPLGPPKILRSSGGSAGGGRQKSASGGRFLPKRARFTLTKETKLLLTERNRAQKYAAQTGNVDDWRLYKSLRNSANSKIWAEKKAWERKRLDHAENSSSNIWKNMKTWLNWKVSGPPTQLFHNG